MMLIGLTGNYGSGKSAVARMFKELGALVIDTDDVVHDLLSTSAVIENVREAFGEDAVVDGAVNKKWLAGKVFSDVHSRIVLENILHPLVFAVIDDLAARNTGDPGSIMIVEATLVFERGHQGRFDKIITVRIPEEMGKQRLMAKGIPEADIEMRLKSQFPIETKVRGSDYIIDNSGGIEQTREQVRTVYQELLSIGRRHEHN
jgi:dephospho-CoA kinase